MYTLNGVGREYDNFVVSTQNRDVPFTFNELRSRLIHHEQWLSTQEADLTKSLDSAMNSAFFTKTTFNPSTSKNTSSKPYKDTPFNTSVKPNNYCSTTFFLSGLSEPSNQIKRLE